jgi:6-phosphogluconolactonase (cycloisomerase 2 family)
MRFCDALRIVGCIAFFSCLGGCGGSGGSGNPSTNGVAPTGSLTSAPEYAYVTQDAQGILLCQIDSLTGAITAASIADATPGLSSPAIDGSGRFFYAVSKTGNAVFAFSIDSSTRTLTFIGSPASPGSQPVAMVIAPGDRFAFVANSGSNTVASYSIDGTTGALTLAGQFPAGTKPVAVAADPGGKFLYVVNNVDNSVQGFSIDPGTGALASIGTVSAKGDPRSVAIHPSGKFLYVANGASTVGSAFNIDAASGALAFFGDFLGGFLQQNMLVSPDGRFAFMSTNGGLIRGYTVNATDGNLTFRDHGCSSNGLQGASLAIGPAGQFVHAAAEVQVTTCRFSDNGSVQNSSAFTLGTTSTGIVFAH